MENPILDDSLPRGVELDENGQSYLKSTGGWALFLAILGLVGVAFMLLAGIVTAVTLPSLDTPPGVENSFFYLFALMYVVMAALFAIPVILLFRFALRAQKAGSQYSGNNVMESLRLLRDYFKWLGIMTLAFIVIYILGIVFSVGSTLTSF